jgi:rubrerythrin
MPGFNAYEGGDILIQRTALWVCEECGSIISCRSDECRACGRKRGGGEQIVNIEQLMWTGRQEP